MFQGSSNYMLDRWWTGFRYPAVGRRIWGTLPGNTGVRVMTMMTNERKIWEAALLLVRRHGASAAAVAQREAQRLRMSDDELTCVVWCWIARSTAELLRPVPDKGERVH
jgi:hypothetical protein